MTVFQLTVKLLLLLPHCFQEHFQPLLLAPRTSQPTKAWKLPVLHNVFTQLHCGASLQVLLCQCFEWRNWFLCFCFASSFDLHRWRGQLHCRPHNLSCWNQTGKLGHIFFSNSWNCVVLRTFFWSRSWLIAAFPDDSLDFLDGNPSKLNNGSLLAHFLIHMMRGGMLAAAFLGASSAASISLLFISASISLLLFICLFVFIYLFVHMVSLSSIALLMSLSSIALLMSLSSIASLISLIDISHQLLYLFMSLSSSRGEILFCAASCLWVDKQDEILGLAH